MTARLVLMMTHAGTRLFWLVYFANLIFFPFDFFVIFYTFSAPLIGRVAGETVF